MTKRNGRLAMAFVFAALLPVANTAQVWGTGLEKLNPASEIQVLTKQAEQGDVSAQINLGVMYAKGQGVPQDYKQAYAWFNIAGVNGHKDAQKNRDLVADMLDPETLSQAQDLARAYYEKYK